MDKIGKIPTTIITGFLGVGKTTIIRRILKNNNNQRIALIINEFGNIGIDSEIIKGCGLKQCQENDMIELDNGCICCTVVDNFIPTINALTDRKNPPDHIIIETSGLSLPKPLIKAFEWPEIRCRVIINGIITVVDSTAISQQLKKISNINNEKTHDQSIKSLFQEQLNCADLIVLNKRDSLKNNEFIEVKNYIQKINNKSSLQIIETEYGNIPNIIFLGIGSQKQDYFKYSNLSDDHIHTHDSFESFVISLNNISNLNLFKKRMQYAVSKYKILRIKGFLNISSKPMRCVIQGVGARFDIYFDRLWKKDESRLSRLVIIGHIGMDKKIITNILQSYEQNNL